MSPEAWLLFLTIGTGVFGGLAVATGLASGFLSLRLSKEADVKIQDSQERTAALERENLQLRTELQKTVFDQQQLAKRVLPRRLEADQKAYIERFQGAGLELDVWFLKDTEPMTFVGDIQAALTAAGVKVNLYALPDGAKVGGASMYVANGDVMGRRLANLLKDAGVTTGEVGMIPEGAVQPAKRSNLTIGVSTAAFQGADGFPRSTQMRVPPGSVPNE